MKEIYEQFSDESGSGATPEVKSFFVPFALNQKGCTSEDARVFFCVLPLLSVSRVRSNNVTKYRSLHGGGIYRFIKGHLTANKGGALVPVLQQHVCDRTPPFLGSPELLFSGSLSQSVIIKKKKSVRLNMTPRLSPAANVQILQTYLQISVCRSPN